MLQGSSDLDTESLYSREINYCISKIGVHESSQRVHTITEATSALSSEMMIGTLSGALTIPERLRRLTTGSYQFSGHTYDLGNTLWKGTINCIVYT